MRITTVPPARYLTELVGGITAELGAVNAQLEAAHAEQRRLAGGPSTGSVDDQARIADADLVTAAAIAGKDPGSVGTPNADKLATERATVDAAIEAAKLAHSVVSDRLLAALKRDADDIIRLARDAADTATARCNEILAELEANWQLLNEAEATVQYAERARKLQPVRGATLSHIVKERPLQDGDLQGRRMADLVAGLRRGLTPPTPPPPLTVPGFD